MTTYPIDYLKYTAAEGKDLLGYVTDRLGWLTVDHPEAEQEIEQLQDMLDRMLRMLVEAAATFCRDRADFDTYSDGRQVMTRVELENGNYMNYHWHPQPDHRDNRQHTILDRHECTSGVKRSVIVSADQFLDVVHHGPALQLVNDIPEADDHDD